MTKHVTDADLREVARIINGANLESENAMLARRCSEQAKEITRLRNCLTPVSAEAVWSEMTRVFDQEGGLSRDHALAILRSMGAR